MKKEELRPSEKDRYWYWSLLFVMLIHGILGVALLSFLPLIPYLYTPGAPEIVSLNVIFLIADNSLKMIVLCFVPAIMMLVKEKRVFTKTVWSTLTSVVLIIASTTMLQQWHCVRNHDCAVELNELMCPLPQYRNIPFCKTGRM